MRQSITWIPNYDGRRSHKLSSEMLCPHSAPASLKTSQVLSNLMMVLVDSSHYDVVFVAGF